METVAPFNINALKRDWIEGVSGRLFFQRVQRRIKRIEDGGIAVHTRGVMIMESDPLRFAAAFFAATYLRMPVIVTNPKWRRLEWEEVVKLVNPAIIFGNSPISTRKRQGIKNPLPSTILIPTGGSSGGVKFAIHRWETLAASCEGLSAFIGVGAINSCCVLPLYHVSGLIQLMRSFVSEGRIAFPKFQDLLSGKFPDFKKGTLCVSLVPTQLQRLMAQQRIAHQLSTVRAIFIGGAPVPGSVAARARELRLPLVLSYGMTETAAMVTVLPPDEFLAGNTNAGRPLRHADVEVLCEGNLTCPVGQSGQIRIKGRSLFKGYHGQHRLVSKDGFLTDDEGYFDSMGRLNIVGRRDRLIISGGEKIDPQEVESAIMQTGAVEQVLVVGWPDVEWGQKLVAFYITNAVESHEGKWQEELRADLVNYKLPKVMIRVPILPLDERGKVDRKLMGLLISNRMGKLDL
jgi:O-succinylbenzoic acid--CoA ligase